MTLLILLFAIKLLARFNIFIQITFHVTTESYARVTSKDLFTFYYIISLPISVFSWLCFISWSSSLPPLLFNWPRVQLYLKVLNHIYVLKWYMIHCLIILDLLNVYTCICFDKINKNSEIELMLSLRIWGSRVSTSPLVYSLKRPINCCRICKILCIILKKRLFTEALYRPLLTNYAHCKPLFPYQSNALWIMPSFRVSI